MNQYLTTKQAEYLVNKGGGGGGSVDPYTSNPEMDGTASPGSATKYARGDHIHPTDTSRAAATTVAASATISSSGLITFKNSGGTSLFTLQLPLYNGGMS